MRRRLGKPDGGQGIVVVLLILLPPSVGAEELTATQVYSRSVESVCTIATLSNGKPLSLGSGFVISSDGLVATNRHVVEGASTVYVKCGHRQAREGKSVVKHPSVDLAIIATGWADTKALPIAELEPNKTIGLPIYVIGNPEGLESTISNGLISGIRREGGIEVIQISAPVSHGSSGGPVLLATGEVIGIATAVSTRGQNLNFALPARLLGNVAGFGAGTAPPTAPLTAHLLGAQEVIDATCPTYTGRDRAACYQDRGATLHEAWVHCWEGEEKPLQKTWGTVEGTSRALRYCSCLVGRVPGEVFLRHGLYNTLREVGEVVATSRGPAAFGFTPESFTEEQWSEMVRATINAIRECRK